MKDFDRAPLTRLSKRTAAIPFPEDIYAHNLISSVKEFLHDNFRGLASLEIVSTDSTIIKISTEYLAYTLKLLLKAIDGRAFVDIKANVNHLGLELRFEVDKQISISRKEEALIFSAATNAGFELYPSKDGFILRTKAVQKQLPAYVYATSPERIKQVFVNIFFE